MAKYRLSLRPFAERWRAFMLAPALLIIMSCGPQGSVSTRRPATANPSYQARLLVALGQAPTVLAARDAEIEVLINEARIECQVNPDNSRCDPHLHELAQRIRQLIQDLAQWNLP